MAFCSEKSNLPTWWRNAGPAAGPTRSLPSSAESEHDESAKGDRPGCAPTDVGAVNRRRATDPVAPQCGRSESAMGDRPRDVRRSSGTAIERGQVIADADGEMDFKACASDDGPVAMSRGGAESRGGARIDPLCGACGAVFGPQLDSVAPRCAHCLKAGCPACLHAYSFLPGWKHLCFECAWELDGGDSPACADKPLTSLRDPLPGFSGSGCGQPLEAQSLAVLKQTEQPEEDKEAKESKEAEKEEGAKEAKESEQAVKASVKQAKPARDPGSSTGPCFPHHLSGSQLQFLRSVLWKFAPLGVQEQLRTLQNSLLDAKVEHAALWLRSQGDCTDDQLCERLALDVGCSKEEAADCVSQIREWESVAGRDGGGEEQESDEQSGDQVEVPESEDQSEILDSEGFGDDDGFSDEDDDDDGPE